MADSENSAEDIRTATLVFAHHIGININNKDESLMYIADESLRDLPCGWDLGIGAEGMDNAGIPYFFNTLTGESFWHHPNEKAILEKVKDEQIRLRNIRKERSAKKKLLTSKESNNSSVINVIDKHNQVSIPFNITDPNMISSLNESSSNNHILADAIFGNLNVITRIIKLDSLHEEVGAFSTVSCKIKSRCHDGRSETNNNVNKSTTISFVSSIPSCSNTRTSECVYKADKESFNLKCNVGCEFNILIIISDASTSSANKILQMTLPIVLTNSSDKTLEYAEYVLLDKDGNKGGTIEVSMKFEVLPLIALWQHISILDTSILIVIRDMMEKISNSDASTMSLGSKNAIFNSVDNILKISVEEECAEKNQTQNGSGIKEEGINSILLYLFLSDRVSSDSCEPPTAPPSVSHAKGKEICKSFLLTYVTNVVPMAPIADDILVTKLLLQFSSHCNNKSSAAWTLTNAVQAANLIANYRISLAELQAIRLVFMQYDRNLHGCILAVDIQRVLKDMHCEYDSEEMSLILKGAVALDGQGKVELGDFLRWWCSTSE